MTLLDDALKAQERGEFYSWYASLSDEKRKKLAKEISDTVTRIFEMLNGLMSQVPLILKAIADDWIGR